MPGDSMPGDASLDFIKGKPNNERDVDEFRIPVYGNADDKPCLDTYWKTIGANEARLVLFPKPGIMHWLGHHDKSVHKRNHSTALRYDSGGVYATYVGHERNRHLFLSLRKENIEKPSIEVYATSGETCFLDYQLQSKHDRLPFHYVETRHEGDILVSKTPEVITALEYLIDNKHKFGTNGYLDSLPNQERPLNADYETIKLLGLSVLDILRTERVNAFSFIKTFYPISPPNLSQPAIFKEGLELRMSQQ